VTPLLGARGGSSREPTARAYGTSGDGPRRHPAGRGTSRVSPHSACGGVDRRGEQAATRRVANVASHLQDVEDNLPLESALRGRRLGAVNPPIVVDVILQTGLTGAGVATAGYGLPNDLEVQREAGTRTAHLPERPRSPVTARHSRRSQWLCSAKATARPFASTMSWIDHPNGSGFRNPNRAVVRAR